MAHVAAFGTTPKLLDEFATKVGFATAAIGDHRASAGTRKTATGQLALKIDALLALPEKEIDPVLAPSRKTDRALWLRDQNARQIMDRLGTRCVPDAPGTTAPTPDAPRPHRPDRRTSLKSRPPGPIYPSPESRRRTCPRAAFFEPAYERSVRYVFRRYRFVMAHGIRRRGRLGRTGTEGGERFCHGAH